MTVYERDGQASIAAKAGSHLIGNGQNGQITKPWVNQPWTSPKGSHHIAAMDHQTVNPSSDKAHHTRVCHQCQCPQCPTRQHSSSPTIPDTSSTTREAHFRHSTKTDFSTSSHTVNSMHAVLVPLQNIKILAPLVWPCLSHIQPQPGSPKPSSSLTHGLSPRATA